MLRARGENGETPLSLAALWADAGLVRLLLERGASPNDADADGRTALHWAAGDLEKVRALVERGADVNAKTHLGNTPVILAARYPRSAPVVRYLSEHGAEVRGASHLGVTALMVAAAADDLETIRLLVDRGADVDASPLDRPPPTGGDPIFSGGLSALAWAAFRGDAGAIELLLEKGAPVEKGGFLGSPIIQAAQRGDAATVRLLLDRGAAVDDRAGPGGFSPLLWAAGTEPPNAELVELLLARGADPNSAGGMAVDSFMATAHSARMIAERRGATPVVEALRLATARKRSDPLALRSVAYPSRDISSPPSRESVTSAIANALPWLEKTAVISLRDFAAKGSPCVSCHNQYFPLLALGVAKRAGFKRDEASVEELARSVEGNFVGLKSFFAEPTFHPAPSLSVGFAMMGLTAEGAPQEPVWDLLVHGLAAFQGEDGQWFNYLPRPPIQTSDVAATALGIRALTLRELPGRRAELAERIERARRWLANAEAYGIDERVFQLLGRSWAGDSREMLRDEIELLLREQRDDGGWGQLPTLESDAYATGQALYALGEAGGMSLRDPAFERGIRYLLSTQLEDGTWFARRRAFPFQPTYRTGFPHGRDGWISASATSWAVIALVSVLDPASSGTIERTRLISAADLEPPPSRLPPAADRPVDFEKDIAPLFENSCSGCHSGDRARSGYRVENVRDILAGGRSLEPAAVPGDSAHSPLLYYAAGLVEDMEMPPPSKRSTHPAWTAEEIGLVRAWIEQGARGSLELPKR